MGWRDRRWRFEYRRLEGAPHEPVSQETVVQTVEVGPEDWANEMNRTFPEGAPVREIFLINPPDIRVGDRVSYWSPMPHVPENWTGVVTAVHKPHSNGVFNVEVKMDAPSIETRTCPCEYLTVIFRPRQKSYSMKELDAFLESSPNGVYLTGGAPDKIVGLLPMGDTGAWAVELPHPIGSTHFSAKDKHGYIDRWGAKARALELANTYLFGKPVVVGDGFTEVINQGRRDCEVIAVKKTRYRIEFDMPNCVQQGWRTGTRIGDTLYYTIEGGAR